MRTAFGDAPYLKLSVDGYIWKNGTKKRLLRAAKWIAMKWDLCGYLRIFRWLLPEAVSPSA